MIRRLILVVALALAALGVAAVPAGANPYQPFNLTCRPIDGEGGNNPWMTCEVSQYISPWTLPQYRTQAWMLCRAYRDSPWWQFWDLTKPTWWACGWTKDGWIFRWPL